VTCDPGGDVYHSLSLSLSFSFFSLSLYLSLTGARAAESERRRQSENMLLLLCCSDVAFMLMLGRGREFVKVDADKNQGHQDKKIVFCALTKSFVRASCLVNIFSAKVYN
jgi:hypothetical protein